MPTLEAAAPKPPVETPVEGDHSLTLEGAVEKYLESQDFHPNVDKEMMLNAILDIFDEHGEKVPPEKEDEVKERAWNYFVSKA